MPTDFEPVLPFAGLHAVEISSSIAAAYCGKMLVDAGADVVKIEPAAGDPMRRWRAAGDPTAAPSRLFDYLAAGKKSVLDDVGSALMAAADLIVTDLSDGSDRSELADRAPRSAVVVTVTPFGCRGPLADASVPVNEFVLQAMCGSVGGRGWPGEEPLQAGGRIGEWVGGTVAAVTAAACVRRAAETGRGETVDVSLYESMVMAMGSLPAIGASVLGEDMPVATRSLEIPSIVPTADGMVGFCTITGQQFQDFLVLIDRPDLIDDADLASFAGRIRRRDEFLNIVHDWAATKSTEEIIDIAVALRIPVAPVATPATAAAIDHFADRGVFTASPSGALYPRVPYRSDAIAVSTPSAAPDLGVNTQQIDWARRVSEAGTDRTASELPLAGVRIADLTAFWAGPVATAVLAALGAEVIKIEGVRRPDGMRFANGRPPHWDQWWEWGPVFLCSNTNKQAVSLELTSPAGREVALRLIGHCDLVVENFSPRVLDNFDLGWDAVRRANPQASMIRMPAFGLDGPWRDRVGFAQTMEQASGMAWMTGHADGPPIVPRGVCDPIAGLHAAFAAIAALQVRDRIGHGILVESTMVEAALNVAAEALIDSSAGSVTPHRDGNRGPEASPQGVYRCRGDDEWVAVAVLRDEDWSAMATTIGDAVLAADPTLRTEQGRRQRADELDKLIGTWTSQRAASDAVAQLRHLGVAAARVAGPADLLADEQLNAAGYWETVDHPVAGQFATTSMPFRFASRTAGWIRSPAPLYGQHTREILTGLLGMSDVDYQRLKSDGVVSARPAGL